MEASETIPKFWCELRKAKCCSPQRVPTKDARTHTALCPLHISDIRAIFHKATFSRHSPCNHPYDPPSQLTSARFAGLRSDHSPQCQPTPFRSACTLSQHSTESTHLSQPFKKPSQPSSNMVPPCTPNYGNASWTNASPVPSIAASTFSSS